MQSNWQETFFRGVALDSWRRILTVEMTRTEADFLEQALGVGPGAELLDLACGNGRHAIELATRGYNLTGVDLSEEFIAEARGATALPVRWVTDDMRSLRWVSEFDGAYCFGNSFGYLNRNDTAHFLAALARALKPGARFIVDTGMAAESILPSLLRTRWYRLGDILMLSENRYDAAESRLDIDYTFVRNGEVETRPTSSYIFTAGELCRMFQDAGFQPVELLGGFNREPYQIGSPRLILVARKQ
jgi:ubiquinone/menaquinone biosynthesis C-methylase UbiE